MKEEEKDKFISIVFYFPSTSAKSLEAVKGKRQIFRRKAVSIYAEGCGWPLVLKEGSPGLKQPFTAHPFVRCANL